MFKAIYYIITFIKYIQFNKLGKGEKKQMFNEAKYPFVAWYCCLKIPKQKF